MRNYTGKYKKLRYFYLNDELHKLLSLNRGADTVWAFNYKQDRRVMYSWSDTQRRMEKAYGVEEVVKMLGLSRTIIWRVGHIGEVPKPQTTYDFTTKAPGRAKYSEKDVLALHEYFSHNRRGRPRKDGFIARKNFISRQELRRLINGGNMVYIQDDEGGYIPIWKEQVI